MKRILKPAKEAWSHMSVHVRDATHQRVSAARKAADKQGIDMNAMIDAALNEVFDEVLKPAAKTSAVSNGASSLSSAEDE